MFFFCKWSLFLIVDTFYWIYIHCKSRRNHKTDPISNRSDLDKKWIKFCFSNWNVSVTAYILKYKLFFDYANKYKQTHTSISAAKDFTITDSIYADFTKFLSGKDYDYVTKSEKNLKELKDIAVNEKYFDAIKNEYEALKDKLIHDKTDDLKKNSKEIKELLKAEIVNRYYFQKGRIEASLSDDPEIAKAISIFNDQSQYKAILTTTTSKK